MTDEDISSSYVGHCQFEYLFVVVHLHFYFYHFCNFPPTLAVPSAFTTVIALGSLIVLIFFSCTNHFEMLDDVQPLSISAVVSKLSSVSRVSSITGMFISLCPDTAIHCGSLSFHRYHNASSSFNSLMFRTSVSFIFLYCVSCTNVFSWVIP